MKVLPTLGILTASAAVAAVTAALVSKNYSPVPTSPGSGRTEEVEDTAPEAEAAAEAGQEQD